MLEIKDVSKKFKDSKVVDRLSFNVKEGEIVGLLGENGAGKTTTLRMISTMLKPTEGTIKVNEYDVVKNPSQVRREIGVLFGGEVGIYDRLSARENIEYFGRLYGMTKENIDKKIEELTQDLKMEEYIDKRAGKFSRGMKQKVSIARTIVHSPKVMLFDEPSTGLDVSAARVIHEFILKCKSENKIILLSSHSMEEVEKLCDRLVIIHRGKLVDEGTVSYLKEKYKNDDLEEVFIRLIGGK
ncbi:ATP-binding cassette domain-containing protein [Clostridium tyrobutyricum]|jgi:sodium transport system ATP-binding protein|uniref:Na+ ABC transporter (ATP-binding protein), NATA n=1 Tax=Clostridium tyrobutyricum DIVETGP TaxID=1408889 RepID=W6N4M2_CLOTY|nr:ATP-binding cassette domain-containing protein [Clostridium tyrobutyricum]AND84484.1 Na+ ABC transporter ATP-binding protein [Clostridium tyrobutyricum]ANP69098.1 ABC transporter [Clostridium tyrobutyricum]MBR9647592.1 ATP-binding cassette domain-containing protein [Clostridium tyrobutyricum]MBV4424941.1 ATP-binding cassette domain-containing protein [Clostridium tyrobutyricum]MBV4434877.1 ATP-binding cassette domain-containing protein [Clostridium tyrobutyricum]